MRILLYECLPRELVLELSSHEVRTVQQAGWSGLKNGLLLKKASAHFDIFITVDQLLARQQQIPHALAVITIRARSNRIQDIKPLVPALVSALKDAKPGKTTSVGRGARSF